MLVASGTKSSGHRHHRPATTVSRPWLGSERRSDASVVVPSPHIFDHIYDTTCIPSSAKKSVKRVRVDWRTKGRSRRDQPPPVAGSVRHTDLLCATEGKNCNVDGHVCVCVCVSMCDSALSRDMQDDLAGRC